jgi:translation elongation factor EF-1beta
MPKKTEIDKENLEKALAKKQATQAVSQEEEIGYHKGCLNTLVNERNELIKLVQITEALMQGHVQRLQELGVKIPMGKK